MFKKLKEKVHAATADTHKENPHNQQPKEEKEEEQVQGDYEQEDDGNEQVEAEEDDEDNQDVHPNASGKSHAVATNDDEEEEEPAEDDEEEEEPAGDEVDEETAENEEEEEPTEEEVEEGSNTEETHPTQTRKSRAVVANDVEEELDDEDIPAVTPRKLARTTSDAITTADKEAASEKNHPPIKMYSQPNDTWHPLIAICDSGCDDDWISMDCVRELGLEDQVQEADSDEVFTTFSGEEMTSAGTIYLTWVADSSSITNETCANIAENGPFDFLVGNNFMQTYGHKVFSKPVLILRARKPQSASQTAASKKAHEQRLTTAKEAAKKISAARELEDAEQPEEEEEEDTGGIAAKTSKMKVTQYEDDEDE